MSKKNQLTTMSASAIKSAFGPPPVLEGEDSRAYEAFLKRVFEAVSPSDVIEQMWTRDFVDLSWRMRRYGALNVAVIKDAMPKALQEILAPLVDGPWRFGAVNVFDEHGALKSRPSMELTNDYICGKEKGIKEINEVLRAANLSMRDVKARATVLSLDKLEQIDQLESKLNARRNALLGEIEYRQKTLAAKLRQAADTVDGDFKEIESEAA